MTDHPLTKRLALMLRRSPWAIAAAHHVYRRFQARYTIGVAGVIFNPRREVLLVEHIFHPQVPWGLPGGWVDRTEGPQNALIREMEEELALSVEIGPTLVAETPYRNHIDIAYLCSTDDKIGSLSYELQSYRWYDTRHLPNLKDFHYKAIDRAIQLVDIGREER